MRATLADGMSVTVAVHMRGREAVRPELAERMLDRILDALSDVPMIVRPPLQPLESTIERIFVPDDEPSVERSVAGHISGTGDHQIHPYDPRWPEVAAQVAATLRRVLADVAVRIEHIGSTAVPDLAARPIPDLQVSVTDITDRRRFTVPLVAAGYEHFVFPELLVDDYFVFVPADGSNNEHIQICEAGSHQERRHLAVRDYLRSHPVERAEYEAVKRREAERAAGVRSRYSAGKHEFVQALEQRALAWVDDIDSRPTERPGPHP